MRKKSYLLLCLIFVMISLLCLASCGRADFHYDIIINGDIENHFQEIDITSFETVELEGNDAYKLDEILTKVNLLEEDNWLFITGSDNVSARVEYDSADLIYIVIEDEKANIKAPNHPRLVNIKDVTDITVISKNQTEGLKIIKEEQKSSLSYGNAKLKLFEETAHNYMDNIVAYKHMPKSQVQVSDITLEEDNILYFDNKDIIKDDGGFLVWKNGLLSYKLDEQIYSGIYGIVAGVDSVLFDAYYEMKSALDLDQKVMFILPDGLSIEQVEYYSEDLEFFNSNYNVAASVNPAISNVALASMITGKSPYENGIIQRGIEAPDTPDIFEYALELEKRVSYIEGNSNLVLTSVEPQYNHADQNGYTDTNVFNSAMQALEEDPDLIFVHFHGIDDVGHEYSPISQQAKNKIIEIEGYIIELMQAFEGKVIILPDHGMLTYYDEQENPKGRHGYFELKDMLVPYYIYD